MRIKKSYENLIPYQVENIDVNIRLDANENVDLSLFDLKKLANISFNRYPDNENSLLYQAISNTYRIDPKNIIAGNGSSELLELAVKTYVEPNDVVMSFEPSFSMYQVYAKLYDAKFIPVTLNDDMSFDVKRMIQMANTYQPKIIFLCNPNNPTGSTMSKHDIRKIINETSALIIVDEAYIEFSIEDLTMIDEINLFDRLAVTRTFSKAYGLASIRLGFMVSNQTIIQQLKKVIMPYHLNALSQTIGIEALKKQALVLNSAQEVIQERTKLEDALKMLKCTVFKSQGNFVYITSKTKNLKQKLIEQGILIRDFKGKYKNYYRITIGTKTENDQLIQKLKEMTT